MRCYPVRFYCTIFRLPGKKLKNPLTLGHSSIKSAYRLDEGGIQTAGTYIMPYSSKITTLLSLFNKILILF